MPAISLAEATPLNLPGAYVPPDRGFYVILFGVIGTVTGVGSLIVAWLNWRAANRSPGDSNNVPRYATSIVVS